MIRNLMAPLVALLVSCPIASAQDAGQEQPTRNGQAQSLPFPSGFEPARYLGKWYEVSRLPTPMQPAGTLAAAEYRSGKASNEIIVKNTAYNTQGEVILSIEGKAQLLPGDPPRLAVSFGPVVPKEPNYFVMHVDKDYQHAVVGTPDRKSLWILARKVPVPEQTMSKLTAIAREAGFDTKKLIVNQWTANPPD